MVAKKTAVQQPASSGRPTTASGGAAKDVTGKKSTTAAKRKAAPGQEEAPGQEAVAEKKTVARKTAVKEATATKSTEKSTESSTGNSTGNSTTKRAAKKATAKKATARKSTAKKAGAAQAAEQTGATTVVAKKTPGTATAAETAVPKARIAAVEPGELAVRPGEDPWTPDEVAEARAELVSEADRLRSEIDGIEQSLAGLMRDSGDGAGDDQADTGAKNITREHELALAANAREMLTQTERALERLDAGTYGLCDSCGKPIGKARMQAFPRATLCVECKQKQERRY